jgi:hypothetical protein
MKCGTETFVLSRIPFRGESKKVRQAVSPVDSSPCRTGLRFVKLTQNATRGPRSQNRAKPPVPPLRVVLALGMTV